MAFVGLSTLVTGRTRTQRACCVRMSTPTPDRREFLLGLSAAALAMIAPSAAKADREYDGVGFLGGADQIDVNNANIRVYQKYPGLYPNIGRIIVKNGPYKNASDIYDIPELSDAQKDVLKKYEGKFVALEQRPEYAIDKINNGLYR